MEQFIEKAKEIGFSDAAIMKVADLTVVPGYRKFCEDNLCGNYNLLPACPPASGTVEEMTARMGKYEHALILQTMDQPDDIQDVQAHKKAKVKHNILTEQVLDYMHSQGVEDVLMMGAGPWKTHSCMSAYCVDAQKMADAVNMKCWENDGIVRYFSLLLF